MGEGLRKTKYSVNTEIANVIKLMIRCHFKAHLLYLLESMLSVGRWHS
jgi:hypothetical protein